jgi:hypothetical protein
MNANDLPLSLPPSYVVLERLELLNEEMKATKRILRAARAAEKAEQARSRRLSPQEQAGGSASVA